MMKMMGGRASKVTLSILGGAVGTALLLQIVAEQDVRRLCSKIGGLRVSKEIEVAPIFSEIAPPSERAGVIAAADQIEHLPALPKMTLLACESSGICMNVIFSKTRAAYAENTLGPSLLVGWDPSPHCKSKVDSPLRSSLKSYLREMSESLGKAPSVCRSTGQQDVLLVTPTAYSTPTANPFSGYVHYRTWAVFSAHSREPIISYGQFGVQSLIGKIDNSVSNMFGIPSIDYSANRCYAQEDPSSAVPINVGLAFDSGSKYPVGIYVRR